MFATRMGQWTQKTIQILAVLLLVLLNGCGAGTPPLGLAPNAALIEKAITLDLTQTEQQLSQQLSASAPEIEIEHVQVEQLEPLYVAELATFRVQGSYDLKLALPRQETVQKHNRFEVYLQRQKEGKTWRLLKRQVRSPDTEPLWVSYLIR